MAAISSGVAAVMTVMRTASQMPIGQALAVATMRTR